MSRERGTGDLSLRGHNCRLAPPEHATVYSRALHRACLIVGGASKLAARLDVTDPDIQRWLLAMEEPPEAVFVACVEIILLYASAQPGGGPN